MKQFDSKRAALDAALSRLNLNLNKEQIELLEKHLELVIQKNQVLNLTRITNWEEAVILHIEDSLSIYKEFSQIDGDYIDIGTGAGFPGIPLAIATGKSGVLLDSIKKKASAVQEFINELGLDKQITAYGIRSEEFCKEHAGEFKIVTARAVSSMPVVLELATPLLQNDGYVIAMRSEDSDDDIREAIAVAELFGLQFETRREFYIGEEEYKRSVCVFHKVSDSKVKLPRRPGIATKKPYTA